MSDDVRTPRQFEPPPWERDQFEELRRRRESERPAPGAGADVAPEQGVAAIQPAESAAPAASCAGDETEVLPAEVEVMMMELEAQEPDAVAPFRKAGMILAVIVGIVGIATVVAGVVGLVMQGGRGGAMGALAASIVIAFGLLLVAGGGWLTVLALRQRGA